MRFLHSFLLLSLIAVLAVADIAVSNSTVTNSLFGFIIMSEYDAPLPAEMLYKRLRYFHPNARVYFLGDMGSVDHAKTLCAWKEDKHCSGSVSPVRYSRWDSNAGQDWQVGNAILLTNTTRKLNHFFGAMVQAASWCGTQYVVVLAEDMWFNAALTPAHFPPDGDYGGIYNEWYPPYSPSAVQEIEKGPAGTFKMGNERVLFDGSYYKTAALQDAVQRILPHVDWPSIHKKDNRIGVRWDTVPPVILTRAGYKRVDWKAACEWDNTCVSFAGKHNWQVPLLHEYNNPCFRAVVKLYGLHEKERVQRSRGSYAALEKRLLLEWKEWIAGEIRKAEIKP